MSANLVKLMQQSRIYMDEGIYSPILKTHLYLANLKPSPKKYGTYLERVSNPVVNNSPPKAGNERRPVSRRTPGQIPLEARYSGTRAPVDVVPEAVSAVTQTADTYYSRPGVNKTRSLKHLVFTGELSTPIEVSETFIVSSLSSKDNNPFPATRSLSSVSATTLVSLLF